jgi:AAA family ATP:ADP antiporter
MSVPFGPGRPLSPIDRFLKLFTDIRGGESTTALLLMLNVFLLLTAYYLIKVVRESLILVGGSAELSGAQLKSYTSAGQAILLLGAVPLYGILANRFPRKRLINVVTFFFVACLVVFSFLARIDAPISVPFYLWVGIFNLMIIAQFWAFANDVYTTDEGKRLFPIVGFGASSGAVLGSWIAAPGRLPESIGVYQLLVLAAGLLIVSVFVTNYLDAREHRRTESHIERQYTTAELPAATGEFRLETGEFKIPTEEKQETATGGAFQLVLRSRYLLLIALLMLLLNWVNTTGEYILGRTVEDAATRAVAAGTTGGLSEGEFIRRFYSNFFTGVNLAGLLLQLFLVSRILKYAGVRLAVLVLPVIAFGGYAILAFFPILSAVRWAKTAENATDYSLQNTVRNVLFLPTTREEKYKAKQAIDSFFVRAGDVLSAALVFVGTTYFAMAAKHFAVVNLVLVGIWLIIAVLIGREYLRLTREGRAS